MSLRRICRCVPRQLVRRTSIGGLAADTKENGKEQLMIAFLKGIVAAKFAQKAYLDVNGVGFEVNMSLTGIASLPDVGSPASVLTYLQTRDDGMTLYGFSTEKEKSLFE